MKEGHKKDFPSPSVVRGGIFNCNNFRDLKMPVQVISRSIPSRYLENLEILSARGGHVPFSDRLNSYLVEFQNTLKIFVIERKLP